MPAKPLSHASFSAGTLTDNELTDLENAESHAINHQPVPVHSTLPGAAEEAEGETTNAEAGELRQESFSERRQKLRRQTTQQQLALYETLENCSALLTTGPSHALWDTWQQLDKVRAESTQPVAAHRLHAACLSMP